MRSNTDKGFDRLAPIYDFLAQIVFGKSIGNAQVVFLDKIADGSTILILGGGTGWLLQQLIHRKPNCTIWYIDASEKMVSLAKQKVGLESKVYFLTGTERSIPQGILFDVVITNFYFDLFAHHSLIKIVEVVKASMRREGMLLVTDFVNRRSHWQKLLLKLMYYFFRSATNIEANALPPWGDVLTCAGFQEKHHAYFYQHFIASRVYHRN